MEPDALRAQLDETFASFRDAPGAADLAKLLRTVCHDVNNALGTLALEHYSVGAILDDVAACIPTGELEELKAALANAEAARDAGEAIVAILHGTARSLDFEPR